MSRALLLALALLAAVPTMAHAESVEDQLIDAVNDERARYRLPALRLVDELGIAAEQYAAAMASAGFFGHQAPDGGTLVTRAEATGYRDWSELGENLAAGTADPRAVVAAWMSSPSHRANVLSPLVRDVGGGHAEAPRSVFGHYWVLTLGSRAAGWLAPDAVPLIYTPGRPSLMLATPRR